MSKKYFDLNDIRNEPSDQQLSELMESVAKTARQRLAVAQQKLIEKLRADVISANKLLSRYGRN